MQIVICLLLACLATGCGPRYVDYFPYHDDGRCKPVIALIPITDSSNSNFCWDAGNEMTQLLRYQMMTNGESFLVSPDVVAKTMAKSNKVDLFGRDLSFSEQFGKAEFVVALELVEHTLYPYEKGYFYPLYTIPSRRCNEVLAIKMRVRIIDVRGKMPCVVLQEIFCSHHMVQRGCDCLDYTRNPWGSEGFATSPVGVAHGRLISDLAKRIECMTWTSK